MVKNHPKSAYYREPVIGFASASDPLYDQLDDLIGNPQIHPRDMLNGAQTVLVLFLPYSEVIYKDIKGECKTSSVWSDAYMHTNELLDHIMRQVQNLLELKGYHSVTEPPTENFDHVSKTARWGHKSNAVIAGIGTFGLNHLLITKRGCLGRMNSLVTDVRNYDDGACGTFFPGTWCAASGSRMGKHDQRWTKHASDFTVDGTGSWCGNFYNSYDI